SENVLPTAANALKKDNNKPIEVAVPAIILPVRRVQRPNKRTTLIPNVQFSITWSGRLQRIRAIWEELQFHLNLSDHPNAISVLLRVLVELSVENYIKQTKLTPVAASDSLARRVLRVAEDLRKKHKIDQKYFELLRKFPQADTLLSADT